MGPLYRNTQPGEPHNNGAGIYSHHTDGGFGENKSNLPIETVEQVLEDAGDGPDWIIENILAKGAVTDFAGLAKKGGKTTFWCHAIAAGARGDDHAGFYTAPARYLYVTEMGNNFSEALRASGLDQYPDHMRVVRLKNIAGIRWEKLVREAAGDTKRLRLDGVIFDTFGVLADLKEGQENDSAAINEKMRPLQLAAQTHDIAAVTIRHAGKDGTARGSSAFEGIANICITIARPEGRHAETVRRLDTFSHYGIWQRNIDLQDGRYVSLGDDNKVEFNRAVRFCRSVLPSTPGMTKKELLDLRAADDENISASTIDRALAWLVKQGDVGEKQLMDRRGKPKVYWLAYSAEGDTENKPNAGEQGSDFIYSHQTPSLTKEFGGNKSEQRHVPAQPNSAAGLADKARRRLTDEEIEELKRMTAQGWSMRLAKEEILSRGEETK